ncbi:DEAD/DEAH box helicase [Oceanobacter mangrovi]|uniref:DEAD/DEAH box helicase n=1 Tax=Oceanobacter mangrovi TaxID=2862510 RepID=UPI001C8D1DAF|nr:DEAD/DEAH box helicase family protein [Oceanobacter mangrovi]
MALRDWQAQCIHKAVAQYSSGVRHFFCQATPGAGKTRMSAELAKQLFDQNQIDAVVCLAPSCQVVEGFQLTFTQVLNKAFDGRMGAAGMAMTYQALEHQRDVFWRLFRNMRVLAIFDEIHHCSVGDGKEGANLWGQQILQKIQDVAVFTLALSGTPWRSDQHAIALARYSTPEGNLIVDYQYSLSNSIADKVCRVPHITLLDHSSVTIRHPQRDAKAYAGFAKLLRDSEVTYESLVTNPEINIKLLELAKKQLDKARQTLPDAGGLVIASNIDHAHRLAELLRQMGDEAVVVSTHRPDAGAAIDKFRMESSRWIIAVGMVAEGTDIPRLAVCCYLSRIRTEMHFRQVLGRVLRRRGAIDGDAWMFMLAEPLLAECAERLMDDLPEHLAFCEHLRFVAVDAGDEAQTKNSDEADGDAPTSGSESDSRSGSNERSERDQASSALASIVLSGYYRERLLAFF